MTIYEQLGKRISYIRKQKKMSQLTLALEAGVNKNYISDLERGRRNPSLMILSKIANAFGTNMSTLLQGVQDYSLEDIVSKISSVK